MEEKVKDKIIRHSIGCGKRKILAGGGDDRSKKTLDNIKKECVEACCRKPNLKMP